MLLTTTPRLARVTPVVAGAAVLLLAGCSSAPTTPRAPDSEVGGPSSSADPATPRPIEELVYGVTSDADVADSVTYLTSIEGEPAEETLTDEALPFNETVNLDGENELASIITLKAQGSPDSTTITCTITADGVLIAEETVTGQAPNVECAGSPE
jgi:ABC-type glycerol-3-phosphate transport system substrate-binding protein